MSASGGADPQVAVDSVGDVTAVWDQSDGSGSYVTEAAQRSAGSGWEAPVAISGAQAVASYPQVVADARGDAVADWDGYDATVYTVQAAAKAAGGAWQAAGSLSRCRCDVQHRPTAGGRSAGQCHPDLGA
ncbi:MAG TPA: hypothetical protein VMU34_03445 [Mycobacterium sp.]|nr:hypothetical protein [Mycobacterium sp.]